MERSDMKQGVKIKVERGEHIGKVGKIKRIVYSFDDTIGILANILYIIDENGNEFSVNASDVELIES